MRNASLAHYLHAVYRCVLSCMGTFLSRVKKKNQSCEDGINVGKTIK